MALEIKSRVFGEGDEIPSRYTCQGEDVSPPLSWSDVPEGAKSLVLLVDDPDAPAGPWVHWVVYDIPAATEALPENASAGGLPTGARQGKNDWGRADYGGPCPPTGRHRYVHKLFALDVALGDLGRPARSEVEKAMQGHVLASAQLTCTYEKR